MRIAVLAHSFPRFPGDTHGPFVKALCEAVARRGNEVHVLVPFDPELRDDPRSPLHLHAFRYAWPDRLHLLGYSRTLRRDVGMKLAAWGLSPFYFLFAERALLKLVRRASIEMIHAHWILPNGWVAARVSARTGVPFAATLHGSDVFMAERNRVFSGMARQAVKRSSHVTSCSADLSERLSRLSEPEDAGKILLVANGTELEPGRPPATPRSDAPVIVAVGRLVDKKGFRYLLEAAPRILDAAPGARIVIGGGGALEGELKAQARTLGVAERVEFTGFLSHDQVLDRIAGASIFVMPSVRDERGNIDGLPIVVLEAMAAGLPVVATDVSGIPLAVEHGRSGLLVPEKDPSALASAVVELLADPRRARAMGEAGRERVRTELNWDAVARTHDRLYRRALGSGPAGP